MSGNDDMAGPAGSAEPSMEEILASIRRILKDDQSGAATNSEDPEDEILVLDSTMVVKPGPAAEPEISAPEPVAEPPEPEAIIAEAPVPVTELPSEMVADMPVTMEELIGDEDDDLEAAADEEAVMEDGGVEAEAEPVAMEEQNMSEDAPENVQPPPGLVGESASQAAAGSIGALIRTISSDRQVAIGRVGLTLEDLVREELRPLLKSWLDNNLPVLVERIVRAEIQRVIERTTS